MLVRSHAFAITRGLAEHVIVELDVRAGLPAFSVIGLAPGAARDARERVQAAVINNGIAFPRRRVTVNLAPASSRRSGPEFDLAIAVCVVAVDGPLDPEQLARIGLFAELGLGGLLRPCSSPAAAATAAGEAGLRALVVALPDVEEARAVRAVPVVGVRDLSEVIELLCARSAGPAPPGGARLGAAPAGPARTPRPGPAGAGAPEAVTRASGTRRAGSAGKGEPGAPTAREAASQAVAAASARNGARRASGKGTPGAATRSGTGDELRQQRAGATRPDVPAASDADERREPERVDGGEHRGRRGGAARARPP